MKKNSKVIKKNYESLQDKYGYDEILHREYYGVFFKKGILKIDTKRFEKHFSFYLDKNCDFKRNTVYFTPLKKEKYDYCMNYFVDAINESRKTWFEQKNIFHQMLDEYIKEELSKKAPTWDDSFYCGYLDYDEWEMSNRMEKILHQTRVERNINEKAYHLMKTLHLETIQQMASHLEHAMIYTMQKMGFEGDRAGRLDIYGFMDGRIKKSRNKIESLPHYDDYDKFYSIWNFTKHNSPSTYEKIKKHWPNLLYTKENTKGFDLEFPSGYLAIEYLNISDKFITSLFDPLLEFYFEFCELCYGEPKYHSLWDYDDYFLNIVDSHIKDSKDTLDNPAGLPDWL